FAHFYHTAYLPVLHMYNAAYAIFELFLLIKIGRKYIQLLSRHFLVLTNVTCKCAPSFAPKKPYFIDFNALNARSVTGVIKSHFV
ncbi:MAG: hypothetical protein FWF10_07375, partial [Clostridiales bacterium]|nr:hypothetical protein [Clostridiales bacterium]